MLDTFAGQKQLIRGLIETLAIIVGEPFAQVFTPIIATITDGRNGFLKFVRAMPAAVKKGFAAILRAPENLASSASTAPPACRTRRS